VSGAEVDWKSVAREQAESAATAAKLMEDLFGGFWLSAPPDDPLHEIKALVESIYLVRR